MRKLTRRDVLRRLASAGLIAAAPGVARAGSALDAFEPLSVRMSRIFSRTRGARAIGRRYLSQAPAEADPRRLAALVCRTSEHYLRYVNAGPARLRELLLAQQRRDFERRLTVSVDGWILSETEARLCAIAALA